MDTSLKRLGEWSWMIENGYIDKDGVPTEFGIKLWIKRYGKNYL